MDAALDQLDREHKSLTSEAAMPGATRHWRGKTYLLLIGAP